VRAQERAQEKVGEAAAIGLAGPERESGRSVQDAMLRPCSLPFGEETTLEGVAKYLRGVLRAPVVLDPAALGRQKLTPDTKVRLQLDGVRLKTGLKLLLEQVGLTHTVVPEDNLLILTDMKGAEDPSERVLSELRELHRDLHELQDRFDELVQTLSAEEPEGEVRKPTMIEEAPDAKDKPSKRTRPG
jgi:hypothetical protein